MPTVAAWVSLPQRHRAKEVIVILRFEEGGDLLSRQASASNHKTQTLTTLFRAVLTLIQEAEILYNTYMQAT